MPERNGAKAIVESWQPQLTRWLVRDQNTGGTYLVRRKNLKLIRASNKHLTAEERMLDQTAASAVDVDLPAAEPVQAVSQALPKERLMVVTLASGRELLNMTKEAMQAYADRIGAEFRIIDPSTLYVTDALKEALRTRLVDNRHAPGVKDTSIYAMKVLAVHAALEEADRVLWLDDSAFVKPTAPDVFRICPRTVDLCGHTEGAEKGTVGEGTFHTSSKFLESHEIAISPKQYVNTGVAVFSKSMQWALSSENIARDIEFFNGHFVDQDFVAAQVSKLGLAVHNMGSSFNAMPGPAPYPLDKATLEWPERFMDLPYVHIIHVTSWIANPAIRLGVLRHIYQHFESAIDAQVAAVASSG